MKAVMIGAGKLIEKPITKANMMNTRKFDLLMSEVTSGLFEDKVNEIIDRMPEVLEEEQMGTMDDMMNELMDYLSSKKKLDGFLDEEGVMKIPFETVFSWFKTAVEKKRDGLR
jgi:hypothetical protein